MKLLLHACCGPCSLEPTRLLRQQGHILEIFYANSNIAPKQEYTHRLKTLQTWADSEQLPVQEGTYDAAAWQKAAGRIGDAAIDDAREKLQKTGAKRFGKHDELTLDEAAALAVDPAKRAARCRACYRLRLEEAARRAKEADFDGIATTLSVSPYQYTDIIKEELERAAAQANLAAVFEDFRPFYQDATRKSRALGMYRQNFCGCRISDVEAAAERAERKAERKAQHEAERAAHAEERAAEEAARQERKAERRAYDAKQAKKRAVLKALREQNKQG